MVIPGKYGQGWISCDADSVGERGDEIFPIEPGENHDAKDDPY